MRIFVFILLSILPLRLPAAIYGDFLAADKSAARYRTQKAHPVIHRVPAHIQRGVFRNPYRYLPHLVRFLVRGSINKYETVKRLHDWITYNIAYDTDFFLGLSGNGSRRPYPLLKQRKTTCGGFARLFRLMGRSAGLDVVYIVAYSKGYGRVRTGKIANHAWNGVKINGKWYIVDCSADSRSSFKHGQFSKKRPYRWRNLFLDPQAKILSNLPYKKRFQFLKSPWSFRRWRRELRVTHYYRGFRIRFHTPIRKLVREVKEPREGGRLYSLYDRITMKKRILRISFSSPVKRAVFSVLLKGEDKKYYRSHALCYEEHGRQHCLISPPRPGLYTLYLRGGMPGKGGRFYTFYRVQVKAVQSGYALPLRKKRFFKNGFTRYYPVRIVKSGLDGNRAFVRVRWKPGYSVYVNVHNNRRKRGWKKRQISYVSSIERLYCFTTKGRGPFFLRVYAKKLGADKYHRQIAVARIDPVSGEPYLPGVPVYTRRWHRWKLSLLESNLASRDPRRGVYRLVVGNPAGRRMFCTIKDSSGKRYREHALMAVQRGRFLFRFTAPGRGSYIARIYCKRDGKGYNTVLSFHIFGTGKGPKLPLPGEVIRSHGFDRSGCRLLGSDPGGKRGYAKISVRPPAGYRMSCGLYAGKKRQPKYSLCQRRGGVYHFYFTRPGRGRYTGKVWLIGKNRKYRRVLTIVLPGSGATGKLPRPGQLRLYRRFHRLGFSLLTPDEHIRKGRVYRMRIRSGKGYPVTGLLLRQSGRRVRGACQVSRRGNVYTLIWTLPDESGRYWVKLYRKKGRRRSTIGMLETEVK